MAPGFGPVHIERRPLQVEREGALLKRCVMHFAKRGQQKEPTPLHPDMCAGVGAFGASPSGLSRPAVAEVEREGARGGSPRLSSELCVGFRRSLRAGERGPPLHGLQLASKNTFESQRQRGNAAFGEKQNTKLYGGHFGKITNHMARTRHHRVKNCKQIA